jgi:hypothetical protein
VWCIARSDPGRMPLCLAASDASVVIITHMPRTTIDIDSAVLRQLKARTRREGKTLGRLVSELLARALRTEQDQATRGFAWTSKPMGARVDLEDKEALRRVLEGR